MRAAVDPEVLLGEILSIVMADVKSVVTRAKGGSLSDEDAGRVSEYLRAVSSVVRGSPKARRDMDFDALVEEASKVPELRDLILRGQESPQAHNETEGDDE